MTDPSAAVTPRPRRRLVVVLWTVLGIVLLLLLTPAVVGSFVDRVFEGSASVRIARDAPAVWDEVADVGRHPVHGVQTLSVAELDPIDGLPAWEERMQRRTVLVTTVRSEPPTTLVRRSENPDDGIALDWTLRIEPVEGGCDVRLDERIEVLAGGWFGTNVRFWMLLLGEAERGASGYLGELARSLDGGGAPR